MELLCTNSLTLGVCSWENVGPKPLQAAVIVVPDIPIGLAGLFRDFVEAVALKEMQFQSLPLLWGEFFPKSVEKRPAGNLVDRYLTM